MDNIKKFEDFLDRMQGLLDNAKKQGHIIVRVEDLENTFPELKESEDERIKKAAVAFVKASNHFNYHLGISKEQVLAWLEKQDEQKPQGKTVLEEVKEEKVDSQKMEVADLVTDNTIFCTKEVLTSDEAARYLGMAKSYLYKLTSKKEIPHFKPLGKMCYFNRQELEAWLQSNRVATETELKKIENENKH